MQRPLARHADRDLRAAGVFACLATACLMTACLTTACLTTAGCYSTGLGKAGLRDAGSKSGPPADQASPAAKSAQPGAEPAADASADRASSTSPASSAPSAPSTPPALAQAAWVVNAAPPPSGGGETPVYRWRHAALEQLLAVAPSERCDFASELASANPIVSANAAIALARLKSDRGVDRLVAAVRESQLRLPMRRAAVEALASLDRPTIAARLRDLLDTYGRDDSTAAATYVPELHADLLRSLARHIDASDDPHYIAALHSPSTEVRLEAVRAWAASRIGEMPDRFADLRTDPDPRVRAAVVAGAAARRLPLAFEFAHGALADFHLDVRLAGVAALGQIGGDKAQDALQRMLTHEPEAVRAAVISALAQAGDDDSVFAAADDPSWHVRRTVAAALAKHPNQRGALVAGRLLTDKSGEVRRQIVAALESWPLERSGPLLLAALETPSYQTRKDAAAQLAHRWPKARDYSVDAPAERRSQVLDTLRAEWTEQFGAIDRETLATSLPSRGLPAAGAASAVSAEATVPTPAADTVVSSRQRTLVESALLRLDDAQAGPEANHKATEELTAVGPALASILEQLVIDGGRVLPEAVYHDVLPQHDPAFAALVQLSSRDATERRGAAKRLAELADDKPLAPLTLRRLAELGARETDALTWRELIRAVRNDTGEAATRLAYAGMSHPSPEVRRLSCGHLGACADPRHAAILLAALDDQNSSVVRAAIEALGRVGELPDTRPLERLLTTPDKSLRVEVAATLARFGAPAGLPALERLAHDTDPKIRRQVAAVMGGLGNSAFTFTLIELLDDELGVRVAALSSLTQITGQDFSKQPGEPAAGLSDQVTRWKRWWQTQSEGDARKPEVGDAGAEIRSRKSEVGRE